MYQQALCSALELIINKALTLNSGEVVLGDLEQKNLTVILDELNFPLSFYCLYDSGSEPIKHSLCAKILVTSLTEHSDCTIKTSLATLKALQEKEQLTQLIKQDKLEIEGDLQVAQQFMQFAQSLHIDWLTELSKHIGDIPTFKLSRLAKKSLNKINFAKEQIQLDASEFLVHEKRLVVSKSEVNTFNQSVSKVNEQVEKLETRIAQLVEKHAIMNITNNIKSNISN